MGTVANRLQGILYSMEEHTALHNVIPSIASLDPANFRGRSGRRTARLARFFDMFLTSRRARFLRKVRTLSEMIVYIGHDFRNAAKGVVADGSDAQRSSHWEKLDTNQFDLNTCFRETIVLLKSFLRAIPEEQLPSFEQNVEA
jgi:hypothetical protein